ncbi:MAG TPA: hypothetical protein DCX06_07655 [Opitutae bacterium]|nr:hypothetical protein [Opitutae bacterium]
MIPKKNESGFTSWMNGREYQDAFDERARDLYPIVVEAKVSDQNKVLFRAYYTEIPDGPFWFWSNHGISTETFEEIRRKRKEEGYVLIHHQPLHVGNRTIHQATWAKRN